MNKLIAIVLTLGLALAASARAEGPSCNASCQVEEGRCAALAGASANGNCRDGFRVCVQRCDPSRQNSTFLDSFASERIALHRPISSNENARCEQGCAMSGRSCVEAGNDRGNCRSAQQACMGRCTNS